MYCSELRHCYEFKMRDRNKDVNMFIHVSEYMHVYIYIYICMYHTHIFSSVQSINQLSGTENSETSVSKHT